MQKRGGGVFKEVNNLRFVVSAGGKVPAVLEDNTEKYEDAHTPLFLVMEYVSGEDIWLKRFVNEVRFRRNICGHAIDLCTNISIAAKEGIGHRDIKPENIIVSKPRIFRCRPWLIWFVIHGRRRL